MCFEGAVTVTVLGPTDTRVNIEQHRNGFRIYANKCKCTTVHSHWDWGTFSKKKLLLLIAYCVRVEAFI